MFKEQRVILLCKVESYYEQPKYKNKNKMLMQTIKDNFCPPLHKKNVAPGMFRVSKKQLFD
jgi:hypothetical protein